MNWCVQGQGDVPLPWPHLDSAGESVLRTYVNAHGHANEKWSKGEGGRLLGIWSEKFVKVPTKEAIQDGSELEKQVCFCTSTKAKFLHMNVPYT